ncbi:MAG: HAD family hydrolase, partial [Actinocrinis sp.]
MNPGSLNPNFHGSRRYAAVVCDYGGVLTNPLLETYGSFADRFGLTLGRLGQALVDATERYGVGPMAALEVGAITEAQFLGRIAAELGQDAPDLAPDAFRAAWFAGRTGNAGLVAFLRRLRQRGYQLAMLTNNVAEWRANWRATIPVDELFGLVVDSSEERVRKPDREIYARLLDRLDLPPHWVLFLDDLQENCDAAAELGMTAIRFQDNAQAVRDVAVEIGELDL